MDNHVGVVTAESLDAYADALLAENVSFHEHTKVSE
jgi:hypothetical protein